MRLGIPRGFFYYDYIDFIKRIFAGTDVELVVGRRNDEDTLSAGLRMTVDEACFSIKLFVGQVSELTYCCDKVLIPRVMKDCNGLWLCPKLLGLPELVSRIERRERIMATEPIYFDDRKKAEKALWKMCRACGVGRHIFERNFENAYNRQVRVASGMENAYMEADWEFMPESPLKDEIILPNLNRVLVLGHCYNIYDSFANCGLMEKLDRLAIDILTEADVSQARREEAVRKLKLVKKPFWEALIRNVGTALELKDTVDGIIYLSSFSCGPDAFITEMVKKYTTGVPFMVLKLDEHRAEAGLETRLEAFSELLKKRRYAC